MKVHHRKQPPAQGILWMPATFMTLCGLVLATGSQASQPSAAIAMTEDQKQDEQKQAKAKQDEQEAKPPQKAAGIAIQRLQAIKQLAPAIVRGNGQQPTAPTDPFAPPDRGMLRILRLSMDALQEERYSDALQGLTHVMQSEEDYFYRPDPSVSVFRSMKFEAKSLLAGLSAPARSTYEQLYGPQALRLVDTAVNTNNAALLEQVTRHFPYTIAGNQAMFLLAQRAMDHSEFREASMLLSELSRSEGALEQLEPDVSLNLAWCSAQVGDAEKVTQLANELKTNFEASVCTWNGARMSLQDVVASFRLSVASQPASGPLPSRWTMFGGTPAHNALARASLPLGSPTWRNTSMAAAPLRQALFAATSNVKDRGMPLISNFLPLVLDDLVIAQGLDNEIRAIDLASGETRWKTGFRVEEALAPPQSQQAFSDRPSLEEKLWFDSIGGQLSSDGQRVFAVEESWGIDHLPGSRSEAAWATSTAGNSGDRPTNHLSAYDIASEGKLLWQLHRGDARLGEFGELFFLGAPLVQTEALFVLGELDAGEVRLFALNPASGEVLYSQYIVSNSQPLEQQPVRRLSGSHLAAHGALILCPTSAGAIVAFDRTSRQLLWGYSYAPKLPPTSQNIRIARVAGKELSEFAEEDRWRINVPRIQGDHVYLTPPDSDELHCLRLTDGELLWTRPREDGLFLAGVLDDQAVLVGKSAVTAVATADGSELWKCSLPESQFPSGVGYFGKDVYYQPLASESVVAVDLKSGTMKETLIARRGARPGNLIVTDTAILSQTPFGVERFPRLDAVQRLTTVAVSELTSSELDTRAEVKLLQGQLNEAIADLEASYAKHSNLKTRELLLDAYLQGLREDSAHFSQLRSRIEELLATPADLERYALALAQGLESIGDVVGAYSSYLRTPRVETTSQEDQQLLQPVWPRELSLIQADSDARMNRDAFIAWRLRALEGEASADELADMRAEVAATEAEAAKRETPADRGRALKALARLVNYLPHQRGVAARRLDLLSETGFDARQASAAETLKREVLLEELTLSENAQLAGPATALLAVLYRDLDRWDLVARQSQRLRTDFADIECSAGAKGADVAKQLDEQTPDRQSVAASASTWPHSQMTVVRSRLDLIGGSEFSVDWAVSPGSAMTNWQMRLSLQENTLFGMDELGRERFRCDLTPYLKMPQGFPYYYSQRAWSRGHLLIYATGAQVFAIDLLSAGREGEAEVLWTQELVHWPAKNMGMSFSTTTVDWGEYRVRMTGPKGISIGGMELIHPELLCGVRNGALLGLDLYTGERLWARDDVNTTASIFGNRERIYLVEQNSMAIVLDTATGVKLGERELANDREIVLAADGKFLVWNRGNNVTLSWQDPWEGTTLWKTELPNDSKAAVIDAQYLAVVQPDWHFRLLRIKDGAVLSSGRIAPNSIADGIGLQIVCGQKSDDGFVIAAGERVSTTNVDGIQRSAINDGIARVLLSGVVFGISANSTTAEQEAGQAPRWTTNINKMTFLRTQPVAVPLLTLACVAYDRKENTLQNRRTEFLILDTRNGQAVLDEAIEGSTNTIRTEAEASRDLIRVRTSVTSIQIRFAEETLPGATPPGAPLPDSPR